MHGQRATTGEASEAGHSAGRQQATELPREQQMLRDTLPYVWRPAANGFDASGTCSLQLPNLALVSTHPRVGLKETGHRPARETPQVNIEHPHLDTKRATLAASSISGLSNSLRRPACLASLAALPVTLHCGHNITLPLLAVSQCYCCPASALLTPFSLYPASTAEVLRSICAAQLGDIARSTLSDQSRPRCSRTERPHGSAVSHAPPPPPTPLIVPLSSSLGRPFSDACRFDRALRMHPEPVCMT